MRLLSFNFGILLASKPSLAGVKIHIAIEIEL